jgi:broad specificity phosphatase PhoE
LHNIYFSITQWYYETSDLKDDNLKTIINQNYDSIIKKKDFVILENEENLEERIIKFFNYLLNNYNDKCILIISHKGIINKIKDLYIKKTLMDDDFTMGSFEIYDIN